MKLLHIVGESKFGGGSVIIVQLARMARDCGWEVDVLTTDPAMTEVLDRYGIGVVPLDAIWREIRPLKDLKGVWRLYRFLRENRYTAVHTHTSKGGFVGRLAAWMARVPIVVHTVHGFAFHEQSSPLAVRVYSAMERAAAHWCQRIVTVSEFHRRWGLSLGIGNEQKVVAIPNGISPDRVAQKTGRDATRAAMRVSPDHYVIVSIGRLAAGKGLEDLLEAVVLARNEVDRPIQVWLPGTGPLQPLLEQIANKPELAGIVRFLGFRDDIGDLLAAGDLVVLPSLREGLSIALLEAMAAAKPIVATTIGSNREVTREGEAAYLVPPCDRAALREGLISMIESPESAKHFAATAEQIYRSTYTEEIMLDRYEELYNELLAERVPAVRHDAHNSITKRALDICLSGAALVILSPLLLAIGIAVRLTSPGPALFRQKRMGRGGLPFTLYKFRSMSSNAPDVRNADGSAFSAADDPRVTPLGHVLRNTSLDELPQLINVFKGDMSLIGPRPELPDQIRFYSEADKRRLFIRPGLTGLAQISGRNEVPWERRRQLDVEYVDRRSLPLDFSILVRTVSFVLKREGIHTSKAVSTGTQKESSL
jgi:lipopolysaccharide/colanic/teichoic acid biosynthesis glycosyltransferase